jgi:hypothetical protein
MFVGNGRFAKWINPPSSCIAIEQQFGSILDDLNVSNFHGSSSASTSGGYVSSPDITTNAILSTTIITNETLWSLLAKHFLKPKSHNATTWAFYAINNASITLS